MKYIYLSLRFLSAAVIAIFIVLLMGKYAYFEGDSLMWFKFKVFILFAAVMLYLNRDYLK